jgi:hypothetical protein
VLPLSRVPFGNHLESQDILHRASHGLIKSQDHDEQWRNARQSPDNHAIERGIPLAQRICACRRGEKQNCTKHVWPGTSNLIAFSRCYGKYNVLAISRHQALCAHSLLPICSHATACIHLCEPHAPSTSRSLEHSTTRPPDFPSPIPYIPRSDIFPRPILTRPRKQSKLRSAWTAKGRQAFTLHYFTA